MYHYGSILINRAPLIQQAVLVPHLKKGHRRTQEFTKGQQGKSNV